MTRLVTVVPNVLSPRGVNFRPDIGHKLYHHHVICNKKITVMKACASRHQLQLKRDVSHGVRRCKVV